MNDTAIVVETSDGEPFRLRSYQTEMVEESLQQNIIVVMDTGSGKTHIAIERARTELETCRPDKVVWFLAPSVTLCEQQYEVFKYNLPGYGIQVLSGKDGVDHWTDQGTWDAVLHNVRIVLSTHQVLLDALTHAFVRMSKLALLIFDEAHNCTLNHPARRIMSDFYKPFADAADPKSPVPKILGLSASPVMKAAATKEALEQIERNLRAIARTPKIYRSELMRFVHKPEVLQVSYPPPSPSDVSSPLLLSLQHILVTYEIKSDPYMLELLQKQQDGDEVRKQLEKLFVSRKTYCYEQIRTLASKAFDMTHEFGVSAMEWYLQQSMGQLREVVDMTSHQQLFDTAAREKQHLMRILESLPLPRDTIGSSISPSKLSHKVEMLIDLLVSELMENPDFFGLVFVEQRVFVAALAQILATHPQTQSLFRVGTFVGESQSPKRKTNIANLAESRNQGATLDDFRAGRTNLMLATSVLEEGIDISSCNLVVDFERPKNLKSFVQRRGRARKQRSKYFIFTPQGPGSRSSEYWQSLEADMRRAYEDELRIVKMANEREKVEEEEDGREFRIQSTGALLTLDNACQHLYHFCAVSATGSFVDSRPQFKFTDVLTGQIISEVLLPICIDPSVRKANSLKSWRTEKMARKDAAFEAYTALYRAGLVNDNLLPIRQTTDFVPCVSDRTASIIEVSALYNPWYQIALCQQRRPCTWYRTLLTLNVPREQSAQFVLFTPVALPLNDSEILLHWNQTEKYHVSSSWLPDTSLSEQEVQILRSITFHMLYPVFHGRMKDERDDFLWLLTPCDSGGCVLDSTSLSALQAKMKGQQSLLDLLETGRFDPSDCGLISIPGDSRKFILNMEPSNYSNPSEIPVVWANRFPKRRDFLHPVVGDPDQAIPNQKAEPLPISDCMVDNLPAQYSIFALLFPSILHKFECDLIADQLRTSLLSPVAFQLLDLPLLVKALTSSSTGEVEDYQELEFYGDCILKFISSLHLMAANPKEPESFLTQKKGNIVSNGSLTRASLSAGLDRYVITKRFTGAKWQPRLLVETVTVTSPPNKVKLSSKLIADVVESIIGASFVVGGFPKAFACIQTLLPLENWISIPDANNILYDFAQEGPTFTGLSTLERLIGHTFSKKFLLLDAITHASYLGPNVHCDYQRTEFLGDAVLDFIITKRLYAHTPPLEHQTMHAIRTATVNASFLAFRMFETTINEHLTNKATLQTDVQSRALWQFLRSGAPQVNAAREIAFKQHQEARGQILVALERDARYPWHLLALTDPPKFLSDIVESVLGAIYIDSRGDFSICQAFVQRLGILESLERILRDNVDCLHPKERLGHLAVNKDVKYIKVDPNKDDGVVSKDMYKCQVAVGGVKIGHPVEGLKRLNTETIAASLACHDLETLVESSMCDTEGEDTFFDAEDDSIMLEN